MSDLQGAIEAFLRHSMPDAEQVRVRGLRRSGAGSSKENWPFDARWTVDGKTETHRLLLRRDPESSVVETGREAEFTLLQVLDATPVPAPRVRWLDLDGKWLERPSMIVDRYDGCADRAVLREADPLHLGADGRTALAAEIADVLAELHRVDVAEAGFDAALPSPGRDPAAAELAHWTAELDRVELEPQPALRFAIRWMRDHLPPPPARQVLVHGDFRPANLLIEAGRVQVLLDWEMAHLGDPYDDLGWYCASIYQREHFIAGRWEQPDFLARYALRSGIGADDEPRLHFWAVMSLFRLAVIALTGIRIFCDGTSTRPAAPVDWLTKKVATDIGEHW